MSSSEASSSGLLKHRSRTTVARDGDAILSVLDRSTISESFAFTSQAATSPASELGRRSATGRALDVALRAVAAAPWRESAHRVVIRLHLAEGNVAEAVRQFRRLERTLDFKLGVRPSELTESVIASALSRR